MKRVVCLGIVDVKMRLTIPILRRSFTARWQGLVVSNKRHQAGFEPGMLCSALTKRSGPISLSSLEKTKVQEQSGMEFFIYPLHRSFGGRRHHSTRKNEFAKEHLQTKLVHTMPHTVDSVTVFCNFKSVLVPSPDLSPSIQIPIIGYVQSHCRTAHAMTQLLQDWLAEHWVTTQIFWGIWSL